MSIVDDHKIVLLNNKLSISYNLLNKVSKTAGFIGHLYITYLLLFSAN